MGIALSREVKLVFASGRDLALRFGRPFDSSYLLLALCAVPNRAVALLKERSVDEDVLLAAMKSLRGTVESPGVVTDVRLRTQQIAASCQADLVSTLHLLMALCRVSQSKAYQLLRKAGLDTADLRRSSLSLLTLAPGRPRSGPRTPASLTSAPRTMVAEPVAPADDAAPGSPASPASRGPGSETAPAAAVGSTAVPAPLLPARAEAPGEPERSEATAKPAPAGGQTELTTTPYSLDPEEYPNLSALGRNLTEEAWLERLDPVIGRQEELESMLDILQKRRANNPCLLGDPGVGKTALAEGLARVLAGVDPGWEGLDQRVLIELHTGDLLAGTQLRGSFAERMGALKEEVRRAGGRILVFIDEIHTLIGAGSGDGPLDAANDLKTALARGDFPCIGATTRREYERYIESDPALERRFQPVFVDEPSVEDSLAILRGVVERYEEHHGVHFEPDALEAAIRLSRRYITDRCLPDKAIHLVDLAGSRARRQSKPTVTPEHIAEVVSRQTGVPRERLLLGEAERMLALDDFLCGRVAGQEHATGRIASVLRRNYAGFNSHRPMGSFLFVGPTGVGKTETVRVLAEFLFESRDAICRFDMSEYSERHATSKLLGAPPGYVGFEEGGQLAAALHKRPYQIVLFDEIEKAHPEVWNLLLQVLDEGKATDGRGRPVSFTNTVIIMTSNLGADALDAADRAIGFGSRSGGDASDGDVRVSAAVRKALPPELWNRIDEKLIFRPLEKAAVRRIARRLLAESSERLRAERGIAFEVEDSLLDYLVENGGFDARLGARPMRHTIQREVESAVATEILRGTIGVGDSLRLSAVSGQIVTQKVEATPEPAPVESEEVSEICAPEHSA